MQDLLCLIGLHQCIDLNINPTNYSGGLLRFYELLSLLGILFAWLQFLYSDILRKLLFFRFRKVLISMVLLWVFCLSISYLLPIIPGFAIPLIGYPYFWKLISILSITIPTLFLIYFSIYYWVYFIPKYKTKSSADLINSMWFHVIYELWTLEAYRAYSRILDKNIYYIFEIISLYNQHQFHASCNEARNKKEEITTEKKELFFLKAAWNNKDKIELIEYWLVLVEQILPDWNFCKYLVENEYHLIYKIYESAEKHKLWNSSGNVLFETLTTELLWNKNSILQKELTNNGYYGNERLLKLIIRCPWLLEKYNIIDADFTINQDNKELIIRFTTDILWYYFVDSSQNKSLQFKINRLLDKVIGSYYGGLPDDRSINRLIDDLDKILAFWELYWSRDRVTKFSEDEMQIKEWTVINNIVDLLFQRLELLLRTDSKNWYFDSQMFWWILWDHKLYGEISIEMQSVFKNIKNKFIDLIIDRIRREEQYWFDKNHSIIKLLLTIFWWKLNNSEFTEDDIIPLWVEKEFNENWWKKFIVDMEFQKKNLPEGLKVEWWRILDIKNWWRIIYSI